MVRIVFFDIDGTLIHTLGAGVRAFSQTFSEVFNLPDGTEKMNFNGRTDVSLVREFFDLNHVEATPANFERFFQGYYARLKIQMQNCSGDVAEGVLEFLNDLESQPQPPVIALLTGNVRHGAEIKLSQFDLWKRFPFGGFADDSENRDLIAVAAHKRGNEYLKRTLRGDEMIVVGDTPLDIKCGRAIGAKVIAVATGNFSVEKLAQYKPDWAVKDLGHLKAKDVCV